MLPYPDFFPCSRLIAESITVWNEKKENKLAKFYFRAGCLKISGNGRTRRSLSFSLESLFVSQRTCLLPADWAPLYELIRDQPEQKQIKRKGESVSETGNTSTFPSIRELAVVRTNSLEKKKCFTTFFCCEIIFPSPKGETANYRWVISRLKRGKNQSFCLVG